MPHAHPYATDTISTFSLQWRHNEHDGVSNHHRPHCLLNRLFRRRSRKTSKLRVTGLYAGNYRWPVNSSHKRPVTRKMFPFDDVIMYKKYSTKYHAMLAILCFDAMKFKSSRPLLSSEFQTELYNITRVGGRHLISLWRIMSSQT